MFKLDLNLMPHVEADPFSLQALIAWLEKQPANEEYCWADSGRCLFAKYGESIGLGSHSTAYVEYVVGLGRRGVDSCGFECAIALPRPRTFSAALSRARAHLREGEK